LDSPFFFCTVQLLTHQILDAHDDVDNGDTCGNSGYNWSHHLFAYVRCRPVVHATHLSARYGSAAAGLLQLLPLIELKIQKFRVSDVYYCGGESGQLQFWIGIDVGDWAKN
jgi:hypothetical protein